MTTQPVLTTPWILALDATVPCLYGEQEGAVGGDNPQNPGRPSHRESPRDDGDHPASIGGGRATGQ